MRPQRAGLRLQALLLLAGLLAGLVAAPAQAERLSGYAGHFRSEVSDGAAMLAAATHLQHVGDELGGTYVILYDGRREGGRLSACQETAPRTLECRWNDAFGSGRFRAVFTAEGSGFEGHWGSGEEEPTLVWNGQRVDCTALPAPDLEANPSGELACGL